MARREPTRLIGRAGDVAAVAEALGERAIVTVCGPGGVGKTRVAMSVAASCAEHFAQVAVVELASVRGTDAAVPLIASALDVEQRQHLTLTQTIEEFIQDQAVLLLLDNCEHVLDAIVPLVQRPPALRAADGAGGKSGPLGLPGESVHLLAPLPVPAPAPATRRAAAAVQLFAERAAEARPASSSTKAPWRRWPRSAGASTDCRWPSSSRRRGCARSGSMRWPCGSISASRC